MLNFILKNTEIRAVPEECGHATVISITERNWYNYTVVGVTARYLRRRLSLSFLGMPCRPQHKESSLLTACDGQGIGQDFFKKGFPATIFFFDVEKCKRGSWVGATQASQFDQLPISQNTRTAIYNQLYYSGLDQSLNKKFSFSRLQEHIESGRRVPKHSTVMQYCQNFQRHVFSRSSFRRTQITVNRKWNLHIIQMIHGSLHFNTRLKITGGRKRLDRLCS